MAYCTINRMQVLNFVRKLLILKIQVYERPSSTLTGLWGQFLSARPDDPDIF